MIGGILSWNDQTLPDFPRLRVFSLDGSPAEILYQAMDLERGAYHFYTEVLALNKEEEFSRFIDLLARAEEGHARLIYEFYEEEMEQHQEEPQPFEDLYAALPGEVLEGGHSLSGMKAMLDKLSDEPCLDIIEMTIGIEYAAYDLYRNMADHFKGSKMEDVFLSIAQAEKQHMRIASEALAFCRQ